MVSWIVFGVILVAIVALGFITSNRLWAILIPIVLIVLAVVEIHQFWWLFVVLVVLALCIIASFICLPYNRREGLIVAASIAIAITVLAVLLSISWDSASPGLNDSTTTTKPPVSSSTTEPTTSSTWKMVFGPYEDGKWMPSLQAIKDAQTADEARQAAQEWLNVVKQDPILLKAAVSYFLDKDISEKELVDEDGWATMAAVSWVLELQLAFEKSEITPSMAPSDGYNSGVKDGQVAMSGSPGIKGDTRSILIELPDGSKIWIMARCGNIVTPPGPPPPTTSTTLPPTTTTSTPVQAKDPTKDPNAQGNAPTGGGKNQDPGPGTYIPPSQMEQPPAQPRVNPPPPTPTTQHNVSPPPTGSVPDPTPPPAPEPQAPTPDDPATGTVTPPGM